MKHQHPEQGHVHQRRLAAELERNPQLRGSMAAMQRAAQMARQIAIQTDTAVIRVKNGQIVRVPADELRAEIAAEQAALAAQR